MCGGKWCATAVVAWALNLNLGAKLGWTSVCRPSILTRTRSSLKQHGSRKAFVAEHLCQLYGPDEHLFRQHNVVRSGDRDTYLVRFANWTENPQEQSLSVTLLLETDSRSASDFLHARHLGHLLDRSIDGSATHFASLSLFRSKLDGALIQNHRAQETCSIRFQLALFD